MVADLSFYIILPALYIIIQNSEALVLPTKPRILLWFSIYIIFMLNSGRNTLSMNFFLGLYLISQVIFYADLFKLLENASIPPFYSYCYKIKE